MKVNRFRWMVAALAVAAVTALSLACNAFAEDTPTPEANPHSAHANA